MNFGARIEVRVLSYGVEATVDTNPNGQVFRVIAPAHIALNALAEYIAWAATNGWVHRV